MTDPHDYYDGFVDGCGCGPGDYIGFVRGGDLNYPEEPHASTLICASEAHREAAWAWVQALGLEPYYVPGIGPR